MDIREAADKARKYDFWNNSDTKQTQKSKISKEDFIASIKDLNEIETTGAKLNSQALNFTVKINDSVFNAEARYSKSYLNEEYIFRKPNINDFPELNLDKKDAIQIFKFDLSQKQNLILKNIVAKALSKADDDGDFKLELAPKPMPNDGGDGKRVKSRTLLKEWHSPNLSFVSQA